MPNIQRKKAPLEHFLNYHQVLKLKSIGVDFSQANYFVDHPQPGASFWFFSPSDNRTRESIGNEDTNLFPTLNTEELLLLLPPLIEKNNGIYYLTINNLGNEWLLQYIDNSNNVLRLKCDIARFQFPKLIDCAYFMFVYIHENM